MSKKQKMTVGPQPGRQELVFSTNVDFMIIGGSRGGGKSELIGMRPLEYKEDPRFNGIFFRREYDQLMGAGGLWEVAGKYYPLFKAHPNKSGPHYTFPSGAKVRFKHMYTEADAEKHRGLQYSYIAFDEITQFSKTQVQFMLTCLRSEANMNSFAIGTCNPDPDSWVLELMEWYLTDDGYPDADKIGKIRYFIVLDGEFIFGDTEEYFKKNYPDAVYIHNPSTNEKQYIPPKTFTFIQLSIFDNQKLIDLNPRYLSELQNLPEHERERQLWGNWYARPTAANYFQRNWLKKADKVPLGARSCRAWDKAGTEPNDLNRYPDYTACCQMWKDKEGFYYITGNYAEDNTDEGSDVWGKFRKRSGERNLIMLNQSKLDGTDCTVVIARDPGSDGLETYQNLAKYFSNEGFIVKPDPMPNNKGKLVRFEPFATACFNGLVYIVESTFRNKKTLESFLKEIEAFDGERSSSTRKDDIPDAAASAFNYLSQQKVIPQFNLTLPNKSSRIASVRDL